MDIILNEYRPSTELNSYVEFFWDGKFNVNSLNHLSQRVVPNGYVELIIHISDSHCELLQGDDFSPSPDYTLIGLFTKPYDVHFKKLVKVFGIRFKPEGIYHIFGMPASELMEGFADIECFTGSKFRDYSSRLREAKTMIEMISLTEKYLFSNIKNNRINLNYLNRAIEIIRKKNGLITIEELAKNVYISTRQLEREFKQKLGLSPKSFMRIARLNEVNRKIIGGKRVDLTEISYASGFSDQAHFIRDFKNFTGESPKTFINKRDRFIVNPNTSDLLDI